MRSRKAAPEPTVAALPLRTCNRPGNSPFPATQARRASTPPHPLHRPSPELNCLGYDPSSVTHDARLQSFPYSQCSPYLPSHPSSARSIAIFGYRYLHSQPVSLAPATHRSALPLAEQPSQPAPAKQAAKFSQAGRAAPYAASSIPNSIPSSLTIRPRATLSTRILRHPRSQPTPTPQSAVHPAPQADTVKSWNPPPSAGPSKRSSRPHSNLPVTPHRRLSPQDHSEARPSPSDPQPDLKSAEPVHPPTPPPAASGPFGRLRHICLPSRPAGVPDCNVYPSPGLAKQTPPVAVPAAMMMTYDGPDSQARLPQF